MAQKKDHLSSIRMREFSGKSMNNRIVLGPVAIFRKASLSIQEEKIENIEKEILRLNQGLEISRKQMLDLYEKALKEVGESGAAIFKVYEMLLRDGGFLKDICVMIQTEQISAEFGVTVVAEKYAEKFSNMENEYMRARAADMRSIATYLVGNLADMYNDRMILKEPSIVIADDILPGEIIQMDREKILALVMREGSIHSHTALLGNMMNIPVLAGVELDFSEIENGMLAIADGERKMFILDPTEEIQEETEQRICKTKERAALLSQLKGKENRTRDGRTIKIYGNLGDIHHLSDVLENDADGIGLFRSEILYLGKSDFPSEEEQYQVYKHILKAMKGKKVIIRTVDLGADKQVDYHHVEREDNPALGYRGIRICLKEREMFKIQLRALLRASIYGELSVMYPMITSTEEVEEIMRILEEVEQELDEAAIAYKIPEQGVMIETPAAAMISDELAELVDFCSIGTNDLTQYMLAVDRHNPYVEELYDPYHKAVLKMVKMVVENVHKAGKWVGICGELAGDERLTEEFVRMGVDELSVSPVKVLKLRKIVRDM